MFKIREFLESSKRIFTVSKKPTRQEYMTMLKVVLLGVILLGVIGYVIILIMTFTGIGR